MSFVKYGQTVSNAAPVLKKFTIANSVVMTPSAAVYLSAGFVALLTSTNYFPLGCVDAIQTFTGVGEITTGAAGAAIGSFVGTYTVPSTNQTVAKVSALVDVSKHTLYSATLSAAPGTTTGSNLPGYYLAPSGSVGTTLLESSASTSSTSTGWVTWGVDPLNSTTNAIVSIYQSQVFN